MSCLDASQVPAENISSLIQSRAIHFAQISVHLCTGAAMDGVMWQNPFPPDGFEYAELPQGECVLLQPVCLLGWRAFPPQFPTHTWSWDLLTSPGQELFKYIIRWLMSRRWFVDTASNMMWFSKWSIHFYGLIFSVESDFNFQWLKLNIEHDNHLFWSSNRQWRGKQKKSKNLHE